MFLGPSALWGHSAVGFSNTSMLIVGGINSSGSFQQMWEFDLSTLTWHDRVQANTPIVSGHTAVLVQPNTPSVSERTSVLDRSKLIIFGGIGSDGNTMQKVQFCQRSPFNASWVWSMPDQSWTTAPAARTGHTAVWDKNLRAMIVVGGDGGDGNKFQDLWAYDPESNQWTSISREGDLLPARSEHVCVFLSTEYYVLVYGGVDATGNVLDDLWVTGLTWEAPR